MNSEESEADTIGYAFLDVNHDGVTELIIGLISDEKEGKYYGQNIYSVYTYNDIPYLLLEGWSRNRCFLLEDGTFYTEGSNGAMYRILENCVLDENAIQLSCKDYYFTKEKDESFEKIGFYHNTTEEWDVSVSEELEEDVFWSKYNEYGSRTISFELVPFSMYQYAGEQKNTEITEDADTIGNVIFSTEELYHYGDFESGNPFVITLTMYGTIPYYGISYETADGELHYYAISESGMDGSAELVKFKPKG